MAQAPRTAESTTTGSVAVPGSLATGSSALDTPQGRTTIADTVVSKIAGIAARDVVGVHSLGGGSARAVAALRDRIPGGRTNFSQGVAVEVGERQAAVDVDIVAEYGVSIADLAAGIRENVITAVERMTGLEVTEVNVVVHDVFVDDGEDEDVEAAEATRVRVTAARTAAGGLAEQAAAVERAVLRVPGVVALHGGALGEVAVHLPGRRVSGVRLRDGHTEVHVVVRSGAPVRRTAEAVQQAVADVRPGTVDVTVEDLL